MRKEIEKFIAENGLTMTTVFVPWSASRAKAEKTPSLNWLVTILRNGREVLTTDYGAGCAHCPSYKQGANGSKDAVRRECETGHRCLSIVDGAARSMGMPIFPDFCDMLYSLSMDASAMDSRDFEDWCSEIGYDTDSRKAEAIYRACLEIGLKLRACLGEKGLSELHEACQDF